MTTLELTKVAQLWYPIIVTQLMGEISEAKAGELLGMNIEKYRDIKASISSAVVDLIEALPSPICELLDAATKKGGQP